jgi:hypothetical protein
MISLKGIFKKKETVDRTVDRTLRIDCGRCQSKPDYGNGTCIRCMTSRILESGEPERIVLFSGMETEYSGDAVRIMNELSSIYAIGGSSSSDKQCRECRYSPDELNREMWEKFSLSDIDSLISGLGNIRADRDECNQCIGRTIRIFESVRDKLEETSKDAMMSAYRIMGV